MTRRYGAAVVLVVALALLGGSIAGAVRGDSRHGRQYVNGPALMGLGYSTGAASPVNGTADARQRAQTFADRLGLQTSEIMHFERNYYVKLVDKQGHNATEVLVDPPTGAVSLEYGPAMMWNTSYGMMSGRVGRGMMNTAAVRSMMGRYGSSYGAMMGKTGRGSSGGMMGGRSYGGATSGMMGGSFGAATAQSAAGRITLARAHELAQRWLDANEPGTKVEQAGDAFPGYYTLETLRNGKISSMISVNASTGSVWPHWWHGRFLETAA